MKIKSKIFASVVLLVLVASLVVFVKYQLAIDKCLDKGGSWNYNDKKCDTISLTTSESNHIHKKYNNKELPPKKSTYESHLDSTLVFKTWISDTTSPHADFIISQKSIYIAENGSKTYTIKRDSIVVYYDDTPWKGQIINLTNEFMTIHWEEDKEPTNYSVFKNGNK